MKKPRDQIFIGFETAPGQRAAFRRRDGDHVEEGIFMEAKDGQSIPEGADVVDLAEPDSEGWQDVEVLYSRNGPPQVATPEYRKGYDRIFGKQKVGLA